MASSDSGSIPANPSFEVREEANKFSKSISTREPSFSEHHDFVPPRLSSATISHSLPAPTSPAKPNHFLTSHQCLASVLKKDGQILSIAVASNGFVYTGSESNVIRVWNLPDFTECDQLKSRARKVVAIVVSNDKLYAAYADRKIRVWCRASDRVTKHVRLATFPRSAGSLFRSYISGGDTMGRHLGPISSLAISISDDVLYSASLDKTVKYGQKLRFPDFKCIETIAAHSGPINAIIATEDGELYTASDDATVRVWRRNYSVTYRPHALTITLSSKSSPVKTLTLSSDGRIVYGGCTDGYVYYWVKGWFSGQLQYGGAIQAHTHAVVCLANVAEYVISGSADTNTKVWAREEDGHHTCLAVLRGHRAPIRSVAAITRKAEEKENGCTVCTGSFDGVLKVWRVTRTSNVVQYSAQSGAKYFEL